MQMFRPLLYDTHRKYKSKTVLEKIDGLLDLCIQHPHEHEIKFVKLRARRNTEVLDEFP